MNIENFINGVNFSRVANFIIDERNQALSPNELSLLKNGDIIWCKTDYNFMNNIFNQIRNHTNNYILITHRSDNPITKIIYSNKPNCIKTWYSQNVDYKIENLIPLPIGIENHYGPGLGPYTDYNFLVNTITEKYTIQTNRPIDKIYVNCALHTNPIRQVIIDSIDKNLLFIDYRKPYSQYYKTMSNHMFVLSPPGNGIDCLRTWEALYFGCIPLVQKHLLYDAFIDLPIIQIEDWRCVNVDFLKTQYDNYVKKFDTYNFSMLNINYWLDKITKESKLWI